jgi:hypothetical protein
MTTQQVVILAGACSLCITGLVLFFWYDRWFLPRRARLKVERLRREEAAGIPPHPRDYHFAISFNAAGFTVADLRGRDHHNVAMTWLEVFRATAFKRDFFTVDCICMFLGRSDGSGVELNEEMARWNSFVEALPQHLPGCTPFEDWFSVVAFPAFAPNATEIFARGVTEPPQ